MPYVTSVLNEDDTINYLNNTILILSISPYEFDLKALHFSPATCIIK